MAKSILQTDRTRCYFCESPHWIEEHHVFGGNPGRKKSERLGLKVYLCHYCHNEPPNGVHFNKERRRLLQARAQEIAMERYEWSVEDFRQEFGKNYI